MQRLNWISFAMFSSVLALVIQLLIINSVMAQAPNPYLAYNPNTSRIVDAKNHTITIIDKKTHQPISVCKFTPIKAENMTTNNTLTTNKANATTCENLTPVKPTTNETNKMIIPANATTNETNKMIIPGKPGQTGNLGNNENLSERLGKLAK
jgi:hypothetical protein